MFGRSSDIYLKSELVSSYNWTTTAKTYQHLKEMVSIEKTKQITLTVLLSGSI